MHVIEGDTFDKPYIVSLDVHSLMRGWAIENDLLIPSQAFFDDLSGELETALGEATGATIELVREDELQAGLKEIAEASKLPLISLDRAYSHGLGQLVVGHLDLTRAVDENLQSLGLLPRIGYPSEQEQYTALSRESRSPVALVDDVIFSGESSEQIVRGLEEAKRPVEFFIAGVGIGMGVERINSWGVGVECVKTYPGVLDEVCERDFFVGVPLGGRAVVSSSGETWRAPYFKPFGDPEAWASIPTLAVNKFSRFCIENSLALWSEVERLSGRKLGGDLLPPILGERTALNSLSFSESLKILSEDSEQTAA